MRLIYYLWTYIKINYTVKDENADKSVQEELVEDMMSLIASFSGKLYGMRSKKNKIK